MQLKAILVKDFSNPKCYLIEVTQTNNIFIKSKLRQEIRKIITYFKQLKEEGAINSIFKPVNRTLQPELNKLIKLKKIAQQSIKQINEVFR